MAAPSCSSSTATAGNGAVASASPSHGPGSSPPASANNHRSTAGQRAGSCSATSHFAAS